jgi:hypothetical protein
MQMASLQEDIVQLRKQLDQIEAAIAAATREGDLRRNAQLTLQACRLRRQLVEAQAQMIA